MKTYVHTKICVQIFTVALFIITNSWQQLRYSQGFPGGSEVKPLPAILETRVWSLGQEDPLEKEMATHSSTLAWKIPWATIHGVAKSWTWLSDFTFTFNRWMAKQTVVHWYNGILFSHKMQWAIKPQKIEEYLAYC